MKKMKCCEYSLYFTFFYDILTYDETCLNFILASEWFSIAIKIPCFLNHIQLDLSFVGNARAYPGGAH
jgi:hypothetical protein